MIIGGIIKSVLNCVLIYCLLISFIPFAQGNPRNVPSSDIERDLKDLGQDNVPSREEFENLSDYENAKVATFKLKNFLAKKKKRDREPLLISFFHRTRKKAQKIVDNYTENIGNVTTEQYRSSLVMLHTVDNSLRDIQGGNDPETGEEQKGVLQALKENGSNEPVLEYLDILITQSEVMNSNQEESWATKQKWILLWGVDLFWWILTAIFVAAVLVHWIYWLVGAILLIELIKRWFWPRTEAGFKASTEKGRKEYEEALTKDYTQEEEPDPTENLGPLGRMLSED